ncbi:chorismate mutase [Cytobacillus firmus]|uniref:Chorismate mutase domain-containing protein n=1 Tax=Cytobacillus firmus TaxID=1399 RepID=A0A800NBA8_CYTFI|nr:chorismate mutase [Cytobacillus firmus]KAF0824663.1 hypothetical protein KIS1582_1584 [Cytobacillus firmus]
MDIQNHGFINKGTSQLDDLRNNLDHIDRQLIELLGKRFEITETIGQYKACNDLPPQDKKREYEQFEKISQTAETCGLNSSTALTIYRCIMDIVICRHEEIKRLHLKTRQL